jgi:hypothetical protein
VIGHDRVAVADARAAVQKQQNGVCFVLAFDVDLLRQPAEYDHLLLIEHTYLPFFQRWIMNTCI